MSEPLYTLLDQSWLYILVCYTTIMTDVIWRYCNACGYDTKRDDNDPVYKGDCPYHQRVLADGTLAWEEFDQDGC